jgi:hypothetical protein
MMSNDGYHPPHPALTEAQIDIAVLKSELAAIKVKQADIETKLDQVLDKLSEARGGWRLLMALGGAAAVLGGAITWLLTHTVTVGPR